MTCLAYERVHVCVFELISNLKMNSDIGVRNMGTIKINKHTHFDSIGRTEWTMASLSKHTHTHLFYAGWPPVVLIQIIIDTFYFVLVFSLLLSPSFLTSSSRLCCRSMLLLFIVMNNIFISFELIFLRWANSILFLSWCSFFSQKNKPFYSRTFARSAFNTAEIWLFFYSLLLLLLTFEQITLIMWAMRQAMCIEHIHKCDNKMKRIMEHVNVWWVKPFPKKI